MTVALILVVLGLLALLFLVRVARVRATANVDAEGLARQIRSVDVNSFRNLVDPAEEEYLRSRLPAAEFRRVHRQRLRAAAEYVSGASQNAALLIRMGEAARRSPDASVAKAGARLVDSATQLRLYALQAKGKLYLGILLPGLRTSAMRMPETYERMTGIVLLLGRLQSVTRTFPAH